MAVDVTARTLRGERLARHGFGDRTDATVLAAVRRTQALQAQDLPAGRLGVRSRSSSLTDADVAAALEAGVVVRSSLMRGTVHIVPAEDVRWLTRLVGPVIARSFTARWAGLGLTPELLERIRPLLPEVLRDGPWTRSELADRLRAAGVPVPDDDPQVPTHLTLFATTEGLVCRTPDRGREACVALLDEWVPDAPEGPSGDDARAELARRYFRAYSPATAADFATWSGLPGASTVALIRDELTAVRLPSGREAFRLGEAEPQFGLRLLSRFDNYLIGYRHRDELIADRWRPEVYVGGIIRPVVLLDGEVAGRWEVTRSGTTAEVTVRLYRELAPRQRRALDAEIVDVGRFLDRPVSATVEHV